MEIDIDSEETLSEALTFVLHQLSRCQYGISRLSKY